MADKSHFERLERLYRAAPVNRDLHPTIKVAEGVSEVGMQVSETLHHGAGALHGAFYFKLLDDAAYFAAASLERNRFLLTSEFSIRFIRPVSSGLILAKGRLLEVGRERFLAEADLRDQDGKLIASGQGVFVPGKRRLSEVPGY